MGLGGEIDNRPRLHVLQNFFYQSVISDIATHEEQTLRGNIGEILQVSGVGEFVKINYPPLSFAAEQSDEIAADKTTPPGNQYRSHVDCFLTIEPAIVTHILIVKIVIRVFEKGPTNIPGGKLWVCEWPADRENRIIPPDPRFSFRRIFNRRHVSDLSVVADGAKTMSKTRWHIEHFFVH